MLSVMGDDPFQDSLALVHPWDDPFQDSLALVHQGQVKVGLWALW